MNWDETKRHWRRVTGRVKSTWRNGTFGNHAEKQIDGFMARLSVETNKSEHGRIDNVS